MREEINDQVPIWRRNGLFGSRFDLPYGILAQRKCWQIDADEGRSVRIDSSKSILSCIIATYANSAVGYQMVRFI
jgi:hypothetical protein